MGTEHLHQYKNLPAFWIFRLLKPIRRRAALLGLAALLLSGCLTAQSPAPLPTPGRNPAAASTSTSAPAAAPFKTNTPYFTPTSPALPTLPLASATASALLPSPTPTGAPAFTPPAPTPTMTAPTAFQICSPLENHTWADLTEIVSHPYDPPLPGQDTGHHGVDFAYYRRGDRKSIQGVPVQSALPGRAAAVVQNRAPYGYMVIIETPADRLPQSLRAALKLLEIESVYLLYAHLHEPPVPVVGQAVKCGETLGLVGNTPEGWSSAPHLHFEVRAGPSGAAFDGMAFYINGSSDSERENYTRWRMSGEFRLIDPLAFLESGLSP